MVQGIIHACAEPCCSGASASEHILSRCLQSLQNSKLGFVPLQISPEPALELIVDELLDLYIHGVTVHDTAGQAFKVYAQLLFPIADYPGLGSVLGSAMKQAPTTYACYQTWHAGRHYPAYKRIYDTHAK